MIKYPNTGFFPAYLSVFGFLFSYQLDWAKRSDFYSDIFLRFSLSFLLTLPVFYLFLQTIHFFRSRAGQLTDIRDSVELLFPLSLFHFQWFQYISYNKWQFTWPAIYSAFGLAALIITSRSVFNIWNGGKNNAAGKSSVTRNSFLEVNLLFLENIKACYRTTIYGLSNPFRLAGLDFYPATWS